MACSDKRQISSRQLTITSLTDALINLTDESDTKLPCAGNFYLELQNTLVLDNKLKWPSLLGGSFQRRQLELNEGRWHMQTIEGATVELT